MNRIRELRKAKGMTMKALGRELGLAESTVSLYERGLHEPDLDTLKRLASIFSVTVDYLLGREEAPPPTPKETAPASKAEGEDTYTVMFRSSVGDMYSRLNGKDKELIDEMVRTLFEKTFGENGSSGKR